ncbi:MAG: prepilin-type N-terminal cleavage/methylation domain-containing protein [Erysipelothrix sp.]
MMKRGFTLMEMVLVVSVIVILFLLTIPNIQKTIHVVNDKGCDAQLKVVDAAILQWRLQNDSIPTSMSQLVEGGFLSDRQCYCGDGSRISVHEGQAVHE